MSLSRKILLTSTALMSFGMANSAFATCTTGAGLTSCVLATTGFTGTGNTAAASGTAFTAPDALTTLGGTLDGASAGYGILTFQGTGVIDFALGATTLNAVAIGDGTNTGKTVTMTANVSTANSITIGTASTSNTLTATSGAIAATGGVNLYNNSVLNFNGSTISAGVINGDASGHGTVNVIAATTLTAVGTGTAINALNVNSSGNTHTTTLGAGVTTVNGVTVYNTDTLGINSRTVTGPLNVNAGAFATITTGTLTGGAVEIDGTLTSSGAGTFATTSPMTVTGLLHSTSTGTFHNAITLGSGGIMTIDTGTPTMDGSVLAAAAGNGTLNANYTVTLPVVGTSAAPIGTLSVNSSAATKTVTLGGNAYANATNVRTTDTLAVGAYTLTSPAILLDTVGSTGSNLTIGSAGGAVVGNVTVANGSTMTMSAAGTINGAVTLKTGATLALSHAPASGGLNNAVINADAAGHGTVSVGAAMTLPALGASTAIGTLAVGGFAATMGGAVNANAATVAASGTLDTGAYALTAPVTLTTSGTLNVGAGGSVVGTIAGAAAGNGHLTTSGNASFASAIGGGGNTIINAAFNGGAGTKVTLAAPMNTSANVTMATGYGALDIGAQTVTVGGAFVTTSNNTLYATVGNSSVGNLAITGAFTDGGTTALKINPQGLTSAKTAQTVISAGSGDASAVTVTSATPLYTVSKNSASTTLLIKVDASPASAATVAAAIGKNSVNIGGVLPLLQASTDAGINAALVTAAASGNTAFGNFLEAAVTVAPTSVAVNAATSGARAVQGVVDGAMAALRSGETGVYGVAAGGPLKMGGARVWVQPFGAQATQNTKDSLPGYKSSTGGLAAGIDNTFGDHLTLGVSANYSNTDVKGKDAGAGKTKVKTFGGTVYTSYDMNRFFVDASGSYGSNKYKTSSVLANVGTLAGKFDGYQGAGKVGAGLKYNRAGFAITPSVSVDYVHTHMKGYSETGGKSWNRTVKAQGHDTSTAKAMVDLAYPVMVEGGKFTPSVHVGGGFDLKNNSVVSSITYQGMPNSPLLAKGIKPSKGMFLAGANLAYQMSNTMSISANYEYEGRSKYNANSGYLRLRVAF